VSPFDPFLLAHDAAAADRRLEAIDQTLFGLRAFRAEVEQVRPGLVLERIDGWHSAAADLYSGRAAEVRYSLAGAERLLLDAEAELVAERERVRAARPAASLHGSGPTPADPVSMAGPAR
jgi:hypothetical protein